ncbi:MAG: hypothetical protein NTX57_09970 [Armatimonadetes bacterium]|nr:hypothetical protein [Armatimonadota bacterium]
MSKINMTMRHLAIVSLSFLMLAGARTGPEDDLHFLDIMFQKRFQKLVETQFGTGRMVPVEKGMIHPRPLTWPQEFQPETTEEKRVTERFFAKGIVWRVGILHLRPVPRRPVGSPRLTLGTVELLIESRLSLLPTRGDTSESSMKKYLEMLEKARNEEKVLMHQGSLARMEAATLGKPSDWQAGEWQLALRPVLAEKAECLSCHTDAKKGETLGALVYMIRQSAAVTPAKALPQ